jgi:hypothetical protein
MAQIAIPNMGPLKNGFSRNPSLEPNSLTPGMTPGTAGRNFSVFFFFFWFRGVF